MPLLLYLAIGLALVFDFLNGYNDSGNLVATVISAGALPPRRALLLAAVGDFAGPFLFGTAVAAAVGRDIVLPGAITPGAIVAALLAAILWSLVSFYFGVPSSSSHALIGGLVGAALASPATAPVHWDGLARVLFALFAGPLAGLILGFVGMRLVVFLVLGMSPHVNLFFKRSQVLTAFVLALSHGGNDAQKTMGVITMALVAGGAVDRFEVPLWVVGVSALAIAAGAGSGGWRIIRTLGGRFYRIRPVHGFTAQTVSAAVVGGAALLGGPVSMSQVVSSAIVGAGAAERVSKVRWGVAGNILVAWVLTIPATAGLAALLRAIVEVAVRQWPGALA